MCCLDHTCQLKKLIGTSPFAEIIRLFDATTPEERGYSVKIDSLGGPENCRTDYGKMSELAKLSIAPVEGTALEGCALEADSHALSLEEFRSFQESVKDMLSRDVKRLDRKMDRMLALSQEGFGSIDKKLSQSHPYHKVMDPVSDCTKASYLSQIFESYELVL